MSKFVKGDLCTEWIIQNKKILFREGVLIKLDTPIDFVVTKTQNFLNELLETKAPDHTKIKPEYLEFFEIPLDRIPDNYAQYYFQEFTRFKIEIKDYFDKELFENIDDFFNCGRPQNPNFDEV